MKRILIAITVIFVGLCFVSGSKSKVIPNSTVVCVNQVIDEQLSQRMEFLNIDDQLLDEHFLAPQPIVP